MARPRWLTPDSGSAPDAGDRLGTITPNDGSIASVRSGEA